MKKGVSRDQFQARFSDDAKCLHYLFEQKTKGMKECPCCKQEFKYYPVSGRKCYVCGSCGNQIYPMANTIFEGSTTKLTIWFGVIHEFYGTRIGVSAKYIERMFGVTYKTAWRMANKVRSIMAPMDDGMISGIIEIDESFFGGIKPLNKQGGKGIGDKMVVFGMLQRGGRAIALHVSNKDKETLLPIIKNHITSDSLIYSDGYAVYNDVSSMGYRHVVVTQKPGRRHKEGEWTCGIESLWSYIKGPLLGTHRSVSRKHFQSYLNEFVFRYNMNKREEDYLEIMLERLVA